MKLVTYNILHGIDGRNIFFYFLLYFVSVFWKSEKMGLRFSRHADKVISLLQEHDADIVCLNEVHAENGQKDFFKQELQKMGYTSFVWSSIKCQAPKLETGTFLAAKLQGQQIPVEMTCSGKICGGRGIGALYFSSMNTMVIGLHLSIYRSERKQQIQEITEFVLSQQALGRKVILMGDFNSSQKALQKNPSFQKLKLSSEIRRTTPYFFPLFDLDHIFHSPQFKLKNMKTQKGLSDHLLLHAELK